MNNRTPINPPELAPAIAPFPQALVVNDLVFISGQVALDAGNNVVAPNDIDGQTRYVIERLGIIAAEWGGGLSDIVSVTAFLKSATLFSGFNAAWAEGFAGSLPARATVVSDLVLDDLLIEVQAIAIRSGK